MRKFVERLQRHSTLDAQDEEALLALDGQTRRVSAGSLSLREGSATDSCTLLSSGVVIGHKIVGNGGRQIVGLFMPGELVDFDAMFLTKIDYNVQAISDCETNLFSCKDLSALIFERRAVGKAIFREAMIRAAISREWMANLGRRNTKTKIAHLLCEFALRLKWAGSGNGTDFDLPITQEAISDVIGVTPMHVGRVLKELEEDGLIRRKQRNIAILDEQRLNLAGDFRSDYLGLVQD